MTLGTTPFGASRRGDPSMILAAVIDTLILGKTISGSCC